MIFIIFLIHSAISKKYPFKYDQTELEKNVLNLYNIFLDNGDFNIQ